MCVFITLIFSSYVAIVTGQPLPAVCLGAWQKGSRHHSGNLICALLFSQQHLHLLCPPRIGFRWWFPFRLCGIFMISQLSFQETKRNATRQLGFEWRLSLIAGCLAIFFFDKYLNSLNWVEVLFLGVPEVLWFVFFLYSNGVS